MTFAGLLLSNLRAIGTIVAAMAVVASIETVLPLHARRAAARAHLGPNLALTVLTFVTNAVFNAGLVLALLALESRGVGLLHRLVVSGPAGVMIVVAGLDFSSYLGHLAMHKAARLWRFHRVHHCDPAVDVTTTARQHPGEGVIRYVFLAAGAFVLGAGPGAFAVYRLCSALNGLLEHANVRVPVRLDGVVSLVFATPNMHKVHHSRRAAETDTNYGNIFAIFDRLFGTFTPSRRGLSVSCGLDGVDEGTIVTTTGLLALPFRRSGSHEGSCGCGVVGPLRGGSWRNAGGRGSASS